MIFKQASKGHINEVWSNWNLSTYDQIFAAMGNFLRFVSTKIVFTTIGSRNANELQILVATNSETPTITWNNQTSEDIARDIHDNISQIVSNLRIEASTAAPMIWVKRHSKPPLEVKVM